MSGMGVWEVKVMEMGCWCPLTSAGEESAGEEGVAVQALAMFLSCSGSPQAGIMTLICVCI